MGAEQLEQGELWGQGAWQVVGFVLLTTQTVPGTDYTLVCEEPSLWVCLKVVQGHG